MDDLLVLPPRVKDKKTLVKDIQDCERIMQMEETQNLGIEMQTMVSKILEDNVILLCELYDQDRTLAVRPDDLIELDKYFTRF
jgi:hypothetical protein